MTRGPRLNTTSALFLDLTHPSSTLPNWASLSGGVPAALSEPSAATEVAAAVARSQGAQAGLVARSSLHALLDVFTLLPQVGTTVAVDEACYPILRSAAASARRAGVRVRTYRHHRPDTIGTPSGRLLVATDGWCPGCNRPAPIGRLREIARRSGGTLVLDDSLACGVLGRRGPGELFGDGTGTPGWMGAGHDDLLWVASFAKAYGTPVAVLTGSRGTVGLLQDRGNRLYSGPPSTPDILAAARAVGMPRELRLRRHRLQTRVQELRRILAMQRLPVTGRPFPIIGIPLPVATATRWWAALRDRGIDAIVQRPSCHPEVRLTFVLSARHTSGDIERIGRALHTLATEGLAA